MFWIRCSALSVFSLAGALWIGPVDQPPPARPPSKQAPPERTLLFVGDVMLSRSVGRKIKAEGDWTYPFQKIGDTLRSADVAFGNLECPVSDVGHDLHHLYSFRADPAVIAGLKFAGFQAMSVANNHMYDWDRPALLDTVRRLREAEILPVGAGANDLDAHYPRILDAGGLRLAFLGYVAIPPREAAAGVNQPGVAWLEPDRAVADVRFARPLADVVIVSLHWGVEYASKPAAKQVEIAHRLIDAGADFVVGGHPHVVQRIEQYHRRWIAYSLGNFIFDQHSPGTHHGMMLKATVVGGQVASVEQIRITIDDSYQASLTPQEPVRHLATGDAKLRCPSGAP
jgi:poly-gamma-glutamate capsule biosynthesis protein CapA/YwtB (metallophosphatase superfamily)